GGRTARQSVLQFELREGADNRRMRKAGQYFRLDYLSLARHSRPNELPNVRPPKKVRPRMMPNKDGVCRACRRIWRPACEPTVASPPTQVHGSSACVSVRVSTGFMGFSLHQAQYIRRSIVPGHPVLSAACREI